MSLLKTQSTSTNIILLHKRLHSLVQLSIYSNKLVQLQFLNGCKKAAAHPLADFQCHERVILGIKLLPHFLRKPIKKMQLSSDAGAKLQDQQRSHLKITESEILSTTTSSYCSAHSTIQQFSSILTS